MYVHPTEILTSICLSKPDFSTDILVKIRRSLSDPAGRLRLANSYHQELLSSGCLQQTCHVKCIHVMCIYIMDLLCERHAE